MAVNNFMFYKDKKLRKKKLEGFIKENYKMDLDHH